MSECQQISNERANTLGKKEQEEIFDLKVSNNGYHGNDDGSDMKELPPSRA